jgi:hypothetical protein
VRPYVAKSLYQKGLEEQLKVKNLSSKPHYHKEKKK